MNYAQIGMFLLYGGALLITGIAVARFLNPNGENYLNRFVYLGEVVLLGSICMVGSFLLMSFAHLYRAPFLWGGILGAYAFLLNRDVRRELRQVFYKPLRWDVPLAAFFVLLAIFIFRNLYFLVDVDSHAIYLTAQKAWLEQGTSLWGDRGTDIVMFTPHFNAITYSLGLSVFTRETFFPQMVVASWTLVVLFLVFGYTSWRFNRWYGLAASMLVLFNDHMFYSGANNCVIINSALVAFLFAAAYNFWESRRTGSLFRLALAVIFLAHLMANKYQMAYVFIFIAVVGLLVQPCWARKVRLLGKERRLMFGVAIGCLFVSLWYIKNWIVTGCPTFPMLASRFGALGWTGEKERLFFEVTGHVAPLTLIKYLSFFYVWPGVLAMKWVFLVMLFWPLAVLVIALRSPNKAMPDLSEWAYWMGISLLVMLGIVLANFIDPRAYRYGIGVMAFTTVFSFDMILREVFLFRRQIGINLIVVLLAAPGWNIIAAQGGLYKRPTFQDNVNVLSDKLHTADVIARYFPQQAQVEAALERSADQWSLAAWDTGTAEKATPGSLFLLPTRPHLDLWHTSVIRWESYPHPDLMLKDLTDFGLKYFMCWEDGQFYMKPIEAYVPRAVKFFEAPKELLVNYGFPEELSRISH